MGGALASQRVEEFWRNTAAALYSLGDGATKEAQAWKTYWHEPSTGRASTTLRSVNTPEGLEEAKKPITVTEKRILQLPGTVSYVGNPEVQIPLNLPSSTVPAAISTQSISQAQPLNTTGCAMMT
ncbi:hypothetical protein ABMA28_017381, partial [Loxostege sticticalis]